MRRLLRSGRGSSVATRVALFLVTVTTVLLGSVLALDYLATRRALDRELAASTALTADRLAAGLAHAIWNLDKDEVARVIESALADRTILEVRVHAAGGPYSLGRDAEWRPASPSVAPEGPLLQERREIISAEGQRLGTLEVRSSRRFVAEDLAHRMRQGVAVVSLLDLGLVLALYFLLGRTVLRPLAEIERYASAVSEGKTGTSLQTRHYKGELEGLRASLERMVGLLDARYARAGESEARFRALFNGTRDAIVARVFDATLGESRFTEANDVACQRSGYSREEFLQLTPKDVIEAPPDLLRSARARLQEDGFTVFEALERTKSGALLPIEVSTTLVRAGDKLISLSVSRDISERKRSEEALRKLSLAVEQSPVAVVITNARGLIEFVNPRFTQTTGYSREEALGQNPRMLKSERTDAAVYRKLWETITAGKVWEGEICNKKKSGEYYWEYATISPVRDAAGAITHYLALQEDITARKQLEEQLRHSQKMEAIGLLAGGVAHDFNNLLSVILGNANMLRMDLKDGTQEAQDLDEVLEAGHRAAKLTRSLLTFGRRQPGLLQAVDLHEVTGNVDRFLRRLIGEDVQLETRFHPGPLLVRIDPGQIEQVLVNLATNARDAMTHGGKLTIETRLSEVDPATAQASGIAAGPCAVLSVSDSGEGIEPAVLARVFEPFFTTKEVGKGSGLGLAIVYSIVRQNAGSITVSSEKGRGTTFSVRLPLSAGHVEQRAAGPSREQLPGGTETILVVEDEAQVRRFVQALLERHGYRVLIAEDGREAVERFTLHQERVALVLMDLIMPRLNGQKASEEILALRPGTPILLTSGYSADILKDRGQVVEGVDLLAKPVQPAALLCRVRELLDARKASRTEAAA